MFFFGKVGPLASEDAVFHFVDSKRTPILLYAVEACPLSQSDTRSLDFATFLFLKLFQTNNKDIINDCCFSLS